MSKLYRVLFLGTAILVLLTSACTSSPAQGTPFPTLSNQDLTGLSPLGTATSALGTPSTGLGTSAAGTTGTPLVTQTSGTPAAATTATAGTPVAVVPITGADVGVMCEFCMEDVAHSIVAVPDNTTFAASLSEASSDADLDCYSVETSANKQLVICYGTALASFTLNVCSVDDSSNCVDVPLTLIDCPAAGTGAGGAVGTGTPGVTGTGTPATGGGTGTTTPPVLGTPTATP